MPVPDSEKNKRQEYAWAISCAVHLILLCLVIFAGFSSRPTVQPEPVAIEFVPPKAIEKATEKADKKVEKPKKPQPRERIETNRASNEAIKTADALLQKLENRPNDEAKTAQSPQEKAQDSKPDDSAVYKVPDAAAPAKVKGEREAEDSTSGDGTAGVQTPARVKRVKNRIKSGQNPGYFGRSTVSYFLERRQAIHVANPVYTCPASGIVVVDIRVDQSGGVIKASINQLRTNTTNRCLWDAALTYAARSRFTASRKNSQAGYITYHFQHD